MSESDPFQYFLLGLTLLFIALKLTGVIDWKWMWVLMPILGPIFLVVMFLAGWGLWMLIKIGIRKVKGN